METKVAYSNTYGGFSLSMKNWAKLMKRKGIEFYAYIRTSPYRPRNLRVSMEEHRAAEVWERCENLESAQDVFSTAFVTKDLGEATNGNEIEADCFYFDLDNVRHDPDLIAVIEEAHEEGEEEDISICHIAGNRYRIDEYDGYETVLEPEDLMWVNV